MIYKKSFYLKICKKYIRLDNLLVILLKKFSRNNIQKLIKNNCVFIDGITKNIINYKLIGHHSCDIILKTKQLMVYKTKAEYVKFNIIYEDSEIILINKPKNLVIHPGIKNINNTLLNGLIYLYPTNSLIYRAGIVHRLDKNASGLIIIAKNKKMQCYLMNLFKYHKVVREYHVLVYGTFQKLEGIINLPIGVHPKNNRLRAVRYDIKGKPAITKYRVIESFNKFTLLLVKLYTGRTHQIRIHMSYIKHPVIGDFIYGEKINTVFLKEKNICWYNRLYLQATKLGIFNIKNNKYMEWQLKLSNDILNMIADIKMITK